MDFGLEQLDGGKILTMSILHSTDSFVDNKFIMYFLYIPDVNTHLGDPMFMGMPMLTSKKFVIWKEQITRHTLHGNGIE